MTQAEKQQRAAELDAAIRDVLSLHRQPFPPATPPRATPPPPVNHSAIVAEHRRRALQGLGPFQLAARRQAAAATAASAQQQIAQLESERQRRWQQAQQDLDRWWAALLRNDPPIVLGVLADAFEDNEAPAAALYDDRHPAPAGGSAGDYPATRTTSSPAPCATFHR